MESRSINFYKGIAILCVIATHAGAASLPNRLGEIGANGARGVQLFFIISSYLAFVSFSKVVEDKKITLKVSVQWIIKKYIKILPLYIVSIALYLLVCGIENRYWLGSVEKISIMNILCHVFMIHGFYPYYINSIQGVEWYLADLFIFYLMTPLLFRWITSLKKAVIWFLFSNICSIAITWILGGFCPISDVYIWETYISYFAFFCQFPVWMLGIIIYNLPSKFTNAICASVVCLGVSLLLIVRLINGWETEVLAQWCWWAIAFFLFIVGEKNGKISLMRNRCIEYIGKISYPMFLFHYLIIDLWEKYVGMSEETVVHFIFKYICIVTITIIVSCMITQLVKK